MLLRMFAVAAFTALLTPVLHAQGTPPAPPTPPSRAAVLAIVNVNVVPMDRERMVEGQTVIVRDGVISSMGPSAAAQIPAGATRIDGSGKFLIPGLMDMHAHTQPGAGNPSDPLGVQISMYLAHGVTTLRTLAGPPPMIARERIAAGQLLGPRIYAYGPSLNQGSVISETVAPTIVADLKQRGFDGLKTHGGFSAVVYDSIAAAAKRHNMPLAGHVTPGYGLARAIAAGQQIEHLDGFVHALLPSNYSGPQFGQFLFDPALLAQLDTTRLPALARDIARAGVWNGPTLALFKTIISDSTAEQLLARPMMKYAPPQAAQSWAQQRRQQQPNWPADGRRMYTALRDHMVRELHKAGAKMLTGSDSPQAFLISGDAVLREIEAFVEAGLSPYAALETATRNPAEFLGKLAELGTIEPGKRADLVLLNANPLASISNIRAVNTVIVDGRVLDRDTIDGLLAAVEAGFRG